MENEQHRQREGLGKSRIEALSDGIFAISMTLLVLSLAVPVIPAAEAPQLLPGILAGMWPQFLFFAIAFFIQASFWLVHHRILRRVQYVDERLIWINLLLLFFIVLIPFSTSISGDYSTVTEAVLFFHFNLLICSILLTILGIYVHRHHEELGSYQKEPEPEKYRRIFIGRGIIIPCIIILAIIMTFFNSSGSMWCYMLIPFVMTAVRRWPHKNSK
jgi:Predicted integral membrane protein